eukprot:m.144326 g.144326  ORF g.144326 m.144326 type:complete len:144 (+) comp13222_c2_seq7:1431-1862(+)
MKCKMRLTSQKMVFNCVASTPINLSANSPIYFSLQIDKQKRRMSKQKNKKTIKENSPLLRRCPSALNRQVALEVVAPEVVVAVLALLFDGVLLLHFSPHLVVYDVVGQMRVFSPHKTLQREMQTRSMTCSRWICPDIPHTFPY